VRFDEEFLARARANVDGFERRGVAVDGRKAAAVAVVLVPDEEGRACFLLTKRAPTLRAHTGQWALPGGRVDVGETPEQAALRELDEEVGLRLPVVFSSDHLGPLTPNPSEVARLYRVPFADLERPDLPRLVSIPESDRPVIQLPILGALIHAPTAAVIYQMLEVVARGRSTRVDHFEQPVWAWR